MEFGRLIEYRMRNIFPEKQYTKCMEKLFPGLSLKNQIGAYLWINSLKFYIDFFYFIAYTKLRTIQMYWN